MSLSAMRCYALAPLPQQVYEGSLASNQITALWASISPNLKYSGSTPPLRFTNDLIARRKGPGDYGIGISSVCASLTLSERFFSSGHVSPLTGVASAALVLKNGCQSPSLFARRSKLSSLWYLRYLLLPWLLPRFLQSSVIRFCGLSLYHYC